VDAIRASKFTLVSSDQGDWIGLYRDGVLLNEGHSLSPREVLDALGLENESVEWGEEEFAKHGYRCPETL